MSPGEFGSGQLRIVSCETWSAEGDRSPAPRHLGSFFQSKRQFKPLFTSHGVRKQENRNPTPSKCSLLLPTGTSSPLL